MHLHTLHINQIEDEQVKKLNSLEELTFLLVTRARQKRREKLKTKTRYTTTKGDTK
jgi:hypothetical protein